MKHPWSDLNLLDAQGKPHRLESLLGQTPLVLVFLRHFACIDCRHQVRVLWDQRALIQGTGARWIFVSSGQPNFIEGFRQDLGVSEAEIMTDPSLAVYKAFALKRGLSTALAPSSLLKGLGMFAKGHRQARLEKGVGDLWQMGGVVVLARDGRVLLQHASASLGDYPSIETIRNILVETGAMKGVTQ
jgi:peroxiredoxin